MEFVGQHADAAAMPSPPRRPLAAVIGEPVVSATSVAACRAASTSTVGPEEATMSPACMARRRAHGLPPAEMAGDVGQFNAVEVEVT
jgi:hypothetical protein